MEMTRRRPRRDSGCIVRSSVCFQITPASSSCRHTAFLISNGSPAQAPASLQCYSLNLQRACKHLADRQSRSLQAKKQDGKGTGEPISIVEACLTLAVGHQGVKVVNAAQAVASCRAHTADRKAEHRLQRYQSGWLASAVHSGEAISIHCTDRTSADMLNAYLAPGNW